MSEEVLAEMVANVWKVLVAVGDAGRIEPVSTKFGITCTLSAGTPLPVTLPLRSSDRTVIASDAR